MRLLLLFASAFLCGLTFSQTTTTFRINYDQALLDLPGNATESLTSNQYVFAGTNVTFLPYGTVTELDANGDLLWSKSYSDGSFGFQLNDIKKDQANSEYYVCGGSESNAGVFMRLDATGNVVVSTRFEIAEADGAYLNRVIKTSDGGYIAAGYVTGHDPDGAGPETYFAPITYTDNNGDSQTDAIGSPLLVKFDANGNHLWHHVTRYYTAVAKNPGDRIYNDASFRDVVETADGYMAVGQYDVNQHRSNQNSDGDDATPTDALIFKTDLTGNIVYHRQVDNPSTSTGQSSKFLSAINKTSVGDPIAAGGDDGDELVMKYGATGAFSLTFSEKAQYSGSFLGSDPTDVSQIYEVNGGTDLVTMSMYIPIISFFPEFNNALHRMNASANSTVWAKKYSFGLATILPRGQQTSDGGFLMTSTTSGASWDYQVIKTDPNGDTPLTDCPPGTFSPSHSGGPTTIGTPHNNAFSGTPGPNGLTVAVGNISPTQNVVCRTIECTPPPLAATVTASPNPICAGASTTITASGPGTNVSYNVYDAATGGTNLGSTPLAVSPGTTTSYFVETVDDSDPTCVSTSRVEVVVTVNPSPSVTPTSNSPICVGEDLNLSTNAVTGGTYSWTGPNGFSSSAQNPTITGATAAADGTYSLTVTAAGCSTGPITTDVIVSPAPTAAAGAISTTICSGQDIELTANTVSGGTYSWTGPNGFTSSAQNPTISGAGTSADGTYSLDITIGSCPSNTATVDITVNPIPTINIPAGDEEICVGETVTITPTTGGTWSSSDPSVATITNGGVVDGISDGTAEMTFTDGTTGCESTATSGEITVNALPTITIPAGDEEICVGETVTITPTTGGTWSSSDPSVATITNGGLIDGISAGTAEMTFTDGTTGCESTSTAGEITVNALPTITIPAGDEEICVGETVTITPTTGGTWSSSDPSVATITNGGLIDGISAGTAEMTFTNSTTGCSSTATAGEITVNPAPTVTVPAGDDEICVGETVTINPITGGTWSSSDPSVATITNGGVVDGISAGTANMIFTDGTTGCSSTTTAGEITVNSAPTVTILAGDDEICVGETVTISPTSGGTWVSSDPSVATITNGGVVDGISAGTVEMTFTDGTTGCSSSATAGEITVNPAPTVTVTAGDDEICVGETVTINPTTGGTWSSSDPSVATITNGGVVDGVSAGTAEMTFTNSTTGCSSTSTDGEITVNPAPTVTIPAGDEEICVGETITITPTTGGTWSSSDPSIATITNGGVVDGASAGTTEMIFTNSTTGCSSTSTDGEITVNPAPTVTIPAGDEDICVGETVNITPNSGGTWVSSDPTVATITNAGEVEGLTAGTIDITFTDATTGCSNAAGSATITVNSLPNLTIVGTDITCNGEGDGEATVTPTGNGPFNYSWSPSGGNGANASGLGSGNYTVVVTDDNGCESNETVTIDEPDELILTTSSTDSECTVDDGTATVSVSGGTGTYDYLWTPSGQTTATATGIGAGSYNVEVTDDNNCTANATVIVESVNGPTVSIIDQQNVSCIGANDGFAEAEATGGTPGYSYSWSPSGGNQAITTGLGSGTFTVEVTDDAGCTAIATVDITEPEALTIDETITDASCGQTDGGIVVNVSGGTPSYTYDWTPNVGNTSTIGNLSGGSYDLTLTDANGCQITQTYNVGVSGALPINITPPSATIDAGESVDLNVVTDPGVTGETYTWTPAEGLSCSDCPNPNAAPDETTTYYVEVTTPDGCSAMDSIVIVVDQPCGDIFVPTIFSPNNDGNNDLLCVYGGCISALEFQIYNRWGELIFTTNDNTECWDGTQNGDPVNTGVYVYKLNVTLSDGEEIQESGNVNVVR